MKFWEAMKAHEEGKKVQLSHVSWPIGEWKDVGETLYLDFKECEKFYWRIKPVPLKYSVDIWLDGVPKSDLEEDNLRGFLFGGNTLWHKEYVNIDSKEYRITVEEVVE